MPRNARVAAGRIGCGAAAIALAVAGCSGTVEVSYRPPGPPPSPAAIPVAPSPTPSPVPTPALACGPDRATVELGELQTDATSRAVPLLIRGNGPVPCGVANPVAVELLDAAGNPLNTRIAATELPPGRVAVDNFTAERRVMVWLQWRAEPSATTADPALDCVDARSLRLTLTRSAPAIPIPTAVQACEGGTVYVSPAEADVG